MAFHVDILGVISCIVQPEYVIQHIIASLRCRHQMEHLYNKKINMFSHQLIT